MTKEKTTKKVTTKVDTKFLEDIKKIQEEYNDLTFNMGKVEIQLIELNNIKNEIKSKLDKLKQIENQLLRDLELKYGKGDINIENGEFTPIVE